MLLDALGTLVDLDDPVGGVGAALAARGVTAAPAEVGGALRREMAFYRANHQVAKDAEGLERLRDRCAEVFAEALPATAALGAGETRAALLEGLRFTAFDEVPAALEALRARGARLVIVSNWDVSLHGVLEETGLAGRFDAVLTSAEEGVAKPDGAIFARGLERAGGVPAHEALHVGDDVEVDVRGAQAAGIVPALVARDGDAAAPDGVLVVRGLDELPGAAR